MITKPLTDMFKSHGIKLSDVLKIDKSYRAYGTILTEEFPPARATDSFAKTCNRKSIVFFAKPQQKHRSVVSTFFNLKINLDVGVGNW